jgi:hypothetical protein
MSKGCRLQLWSPALYLGSCLRWWRATMLRKFKLAVSPCLAKVTRVYKNRGVS